MWYGAPPCIRKYLKNYVEIFHLNSVINIILFHFIFVHLNNNMIFSFFNKLYTLTQKWCQL